ncbi:MAG: LLM class flavin-dependent oxidoreductase [Actinomycetia bacterium]|nr:LLM class flavin-dependent oxidoreductase [Actinomycetes bacterium]
MRTGLNLIPECPIAEMVEFAAAAETMGFERCWVYDEGLAARDVYLTLAAIAAGTKRMQLGPGITNPYTRHPAQTASATASLDELSGRRAFLGVGAGGSLTLDPMGLTRVRPLAAVRETIEACRALLDGGRVDLDGEVVQLRSAHLGYGRPSTEIWLAGRGPKMLQLGGAIADGVMLDFIYQPSLADSVSLVESGAAGAGRRALLCYSTALVMDDHDLEVVRPHLTYRLVDARPSVHEALGMTEADVERIRTALAGGLVEAATHVRDEWVLPFVISGSERECAVALGDLVDRHGFSEFVLPMFSRDDPVAYMQRSASVLRRAH